jgi:transglutaminase-like putative cysteine protease
MLKTSWVRFIALKRFGVINSAVFLLLLTASCLLGQTVQPGVNTGIPPEWVQETEFAKDTSSTSTNQDPYGQSLVLYEKQENVLTSESFTHLVKEITSVTGAQKEANLSISYDPSFQKLTIHKVVIHRNGQVLERLDPGKFKLIQQETDLNRQIYNGTVSAVLFLDDVRVGDQIEYAYTLSGHNPVWQNQYANQFLAGFSVPVRHVKYRLLWPEGRELYFRSFGTDAKPAVTELGSLRQYLWDFQNVPAVVVEDRVPSWFPAFPWIQVSSFKNWSEVAEWATKLYADTKADTSALKDCIAKLQRPGTTAEATILSALEFVQNEIRYLGIEFGPNSYHPTDPLTVLQRRFGDCNDKAFLLCTLLNGLGFQATPVLVATGIRHTLPDLLPAPTDFDHVIVRITANGRTYWVDPTDPYQHGPLSERRLSNYGFGLLLQPGETGLTPMPQAGSSSAETETTETFQVGGQKAPTRLTVVTTFKNFDAEWMRALLADSGSDVCAKSYLNEYARFYPSMTSSAPLMIDDHADENILTITQQYSIPNFWVLSADKQRYTGQFYPLGIHAWITKPSTVSRSMPLELSFPRRRIVHTEIDLPRQFKISSLTNTIAGPAAELHVLRTAPPQKVRLDYEYCTRTNCVPVSLVPEHLKSIDEMEKAIDFSLYWQNMELLSARWFNWPIFLTALLFTAACLVGLMVCYRRQCRRAGSPPPLPLTASNSHLQGLGGWLILVALGLFSSLFLNTLQVVQSLKCYSFYTWQALTTPEGSNYNPAWGPLLTFELLAKLAMILLVGFNLILFFQKRRGFPRWFIIMLAANAFIVISDIIALQTFIHTPVTPADSAKHVQSVFHVVIGSCIWIPYMCVSLRIKATFVR